MTYLQRNSLEAQTFFQPLILQEMFAPWIEIPHLAKGSVLSNY